MKLNKIQSTIKNKCLFKQNWMLGREIISEIRFRLDIKISAVELRYHIKQLRLAGLPVIASSNGYKLAKDKIELEDYLDTRFNELYCETKCLYAMRGGK